MGDGGDVSALETLSDQELLAAFGGEARVAALHSHFALLRAANITMGIVSMNFTAVIKKALDRIGTLGQFFGAESIIGRDSAIMRRNDNDKGAVISVLMKSNGMRFEQALFVDDSARNIKSAQGICSTLRVCARKGMDGANMRAIEQRLDRSKARATLTVSPATPSLDRKAKAQRALGSPLSPFGALSFDSNSMAMDMTPAKSQRTSRRSLFAANANSSSPVAVMDMMSAFGAMSVTPCQRTKQRTRLAFMDDSDVEEENEDENENEDGAGFLSAMW